MAGSVGYDLLTIPVQLLVALPYSRHAFYRFDPGHGQLLSSVNVLLFYKDQSLPHSASSTSRDVADWLSITSRTRCSFGARTFGVALCGASDSLG